jgi:hypothetical protein
MSMFLLTDFARSCVDNWYSEVKNYNFATGKSINGAVTGHFTQIVWKNTNLVGFGMSVTRSGRMSRMYCVGNYNRPGNIFGQYTSNVFPKS